MSNRLKRELSPPPVTPPIKSDTILTLNEYDDCKVNSSVISDGGMTNNRLNESSIILASSISRNKSPHKKAIDYMRASYDIAHSRNSALLPQVESSRGSKERGGRPPKTATTTIENVTPIMSVRKH